MKVHILLGPPGSGKGTQAKRLVAKRSLIHLSTGDILRDAVSKGTEIGLRVKALLASGKLVDDDTVNGIVFARLQDETGDVLFDGYPRTLAQAEALQTFLSKQGLALGYVMDIEVQEAALAERIVNRRTCSNNDCGAIYNLSSKPPRKEGVCDLCGSPLKHRSDDTLEAFQTRMGAFNETFQPLQAFYKGMPNYRLFDGTRPPEVTSEQLAQLFQE
jgi:adenylate kinase